MIYIALFTWILFQMKAPTWCFVLLGIAFFLNLVRFGVDMYKRGQKES